ncbi:stage II sporulation protein D [Caldicellulosiruptor bescii]|uniref:Stage II sporulation protein D n=2 Tax=Caldicellulosiruptor bescii TaxID=31899 RepID=B9MMD7_CALBD|nr:stage II sporulation protein D [Caldicellulosiruptor bescii]ACM59369.1 stage II sporulation protein D [Caldicellulosiruptor bescii DSM 6725]PBC88174.1 stage II sporulation protein D [Caldicellulosiruptor bescii]PBC92345.1 stage II sporulation protein D [Caldicellulosiruptor bescii]PBD04844.1 stage II sporulation protein D [Caldicellulosiruptor bescii]PBD05526.1 stage II sporulation protein D [Caldicellulosiruptor bescii]
MKKEVSKRRYNFFWLDKTLMLLALVVLLIANIVTKPEQNNYKNMQKEKDKVTQESGIQSTPTLPQNKNQKEDIYINLLRKNKNRIERISLEEYVIGVVAAEMPAEFNLEALKAQTVASRTYAARKIVGKALHKGYEEKKVYLCDDFSHCQAYIDKDEMKRRWGKNFEKYYKKIRMAVEETKGQVLVYKGQVIDSLFHAASGGRTEDAKEVFKEEIPYLKSVVSRGEESCPKFSGEFYFTYNDLLKRLKKYFPGLKVNTQNISSQIKVVERTATQRVKTVKIGNTILSGNQFRSIFGLYSTEFWLYPDRRGLRIQTRGYGHGLGMSQWGANHLARQGKNYKQILLYYYQNVKICRLKYK